MGRKGKVSQVFDSNTQGSRLWRRPKTDGGIVYQQILNVKLKKEREVKKNRAEWKTSIMEAKVRKGL
jgi:hypothetical protein